MLPHLPFTLPPHPSLPVALGVVRHLCVRVCAVVEGDFALLWPFSKFVMRIAHAARTHICKKRRREKKEGGTINEQNFSVRVNMSTYIRQKLLDVYISPKRNRELQDALSDSGRSFSNSGTMAVLWCARECRCLKIRWCRVRTRDAPTVGGFVQVS